MSPVATVSFVYLGLASARTSSWYSKQNVLHVFRMNALNSGELAQKFPDDPADDLLVDVIVAVPPPPDESLLVGGETGRRAVNCATHS